MHVHPLPLHQLRCLFYFDYRNLLVIEPGQPPVITGNPWLNLISNLYIYIYIFSSPIISLLLSLPKPIYFGIIRVSIA